MKKLPFLIIFLLLLLRLEIARAQVVKSVSIRSGLASTFPKIEEMQDGKPVNESIYNRNMLYPEFQAELFPKKQFSLIANLGYVSKGFSYTGTWSGSWVSGAGSGRVAANADYFTITVAPKLYLSTDKTKLYGFIGPYIGFRNSYDTYYKQGLYFMGDFMEVQVLKPKVWGGTIGGGLEFQKQNKKLYHSVQIQYMQDFTKAVEFQYAYTNKYGRNYYYLFNAKFQTLLISYGLHYTFR